MQNERNSGLNSAIDKLCEEIGKPMRLSGSALRKLLQGNVFAMTLKERRGDRWETVKTPIPDDDFLRLLQASKKYGLDPLNKEIYPYFNMDGSMTPTLTIDGWLKLVNSQPDYEGYEQSFSQEMIDIPGTNKKVVAWYEVKIYRKSLPRPIVVREYFEEVFRGVRRSDRNGKDLGYAKTPWVSCPNRMMRHRTFIQAARYAFPCGGLGYEDGAGGVDTSEEAREAVPEVKTSEQQTLAPQAADSKMDSTPNAKEDRQAQGITAEQLKANVEKHKAESAPKRICEKYNMTNLEVFDAFLQKTFSRARKTNTAPREVIGWIMKMWVGDEQKHALEAWNAFQAPAISA